jgi:hypothetical protein
MDNDSWLNDRLTFLKALKIRTEQQELIVLLTENPNRTSLDKKKLTALIKAEKASIRANKARQEAANLINAEKKALTTAARSARTHELCESAGLMGLAGLVDTVSGKPTIDRGELLGALLGLAKVPPEDSRRADWKRAGDALLAKKESAS